MKKNVVVSLSGGMDSSTLLLRCLSEYDNITALSFDYGQKHKVELERAQQLVGYLLQNGLLSYNPDCRVMNYSMGLPKTKEVL